MAASGGTRVGVRGNGRRAMKGEVSLYFRSSILRKLKPKELMTKNGQSKERERFGGGEVRWKSTGK